MAKLSDIAKITIDLQTASLGRATFGIPLIAARLGPAFPERTYTFEDAPSAEDLLGQDNVTKLPAAVIDAIRVAFMQSPRIERVVVGNIYESTTEIVQVDKTAFSTGTGAAATAPQGTDFSILIDGSSIAYTTPAAADTLATVTQKLYDDAIAVPSTALRYNVTVDTAAGTISFTPKDNTVVPVVTAGVRTTLTETKAMVGTYAENLHDIQGANNAWYGFTVLGIDDADIYASTGPAAWAEATEPKVQYWATSSTPAIWKTGNTSDVLAMLSLAKYHRTVFTPTKNAGEQPQIAAMARFFVGEPGQIIAGLKTFTGVKPSKFTPDEAAEILGTNSSGNVKRGNTYEQYTANIFLFNPGKTVAGDWVDEIRDKDWLENYIQTTMVGAMIRSPKIPYTNPGITTLVNILQGCLRYAQQQGVIAPDQIDSLGNTVPGFQISAPNALDVPFDVKASRVLTLKFVALLAGAIQKVEIQGVLTYSYTGA